MTELSQKSVWGMLFLSYWLKGLSQIKTKVKDNKATHKKLNISPSNLGKIHTT
jgi:hypothetical protein